MSSKTCGGPVPIEWKFFNLDGTIDSHFFLRDDQTAGLSSETRWSLFRERPTKYYGRVVVLGSMCLGQAMKIASEEIHDLMF